jgi:hypothetical protein
MLISASGSIPINLFLIFRVPHSRGTRNICCLRIKQAWFLRSIRFVSLVLWFVCFPVFKTGACESILMMMFFVLKSANTTFPHKEIEWNSELFDKARSLNVRVILEKPGAFYCGQTSRMHMNILVIK